MSTLTPVRSRVNPASPVDVQTDPRNPPTPFGVVAYAVLADTRLRPEDKLLLIALQKFGWRDAQCQPSNAQLAEAAALPVSAVRRGLDQLEGAGFIVRVRTSNNPTWRVIHLVWLLDPGRHPIRGRAVAPAPTAQPPCAPKAGPPAHQAQQSRNNEGEKHHPDDDVSSLDPETIPERARTQAAELFGPGEETDRRLEKLAHLADPRWITAALVAAGKVKRRDGRVGWGYLIATLRDWSAVGSPPREFRPPPPSMPLRATVRAPAPPPPEPEPLDLGALTASQRAFVDRLTNGGRARLEELAPGKRVWLLRAYATRDHDGAGDRRAREYLGADCFVTSVGARVCPGVVGGADVKSNRGFMGQVPHRGMKSLPLLSSLMPPGVFSSEHR